MIAQSAKGVIGTSATRLFCDSQSNQSSWALYHTQNARFTQHHMTSHAGKLRTSINPLTFVFGTHSEEAKVANGCLIWYVWLVDWRWKSSKFVWAIVHPPCWRFMSVWEDEHGWASLKFTHSKLAVNSWLPTTLRTQKLVSPIKKVECIYNSVHCHHELSGLFLHSLCRFFQIVVGSVVGPLQTGIPKQHSHPGCQTRVSEGKQKHAVPMNMTASGCIATSLPHRHELCRRTMQHVVKQEIKRANQRYKPLSWQTEQIIRQSDSIDELRKHHSGRFQSSVTQVRTAIIKPSHCPYDSFTL